MENPRNNFQRLYNRVPRVNPDEMMQRANKEAVDAAKKEVEKILGEMKSAPTPPFSLGILSENFWSTLAIVLIALHFSGETHLSLLWCAFPALVPTIILAIIQGSLGILRWWTKRKLKKT